MSFLEAERQLIVHSVLCLVKPHLRRKASPQGLDPCIVALLYKKPVRCWVPDPTFLCHQTRPQMKTSFSRRLNHSKPRMETEAEVQTDYCLIVVACTGQWRSCAVVAHARQDSQRADMKMGSLLAKALKVRRR